jgi:hypothetical protein
LSIQLREHGLNRERFVGALREAVQDTAAASTISLLSRPPGRKPKQELVALSDWFNGLASHDRRRVERVIEMTASATFGILCVLDGVRAIEARPDKGILDLRYRRGDVDVSLNDETGEQLHDLHGGLNLK